MLVHGLCAISAAVLTALDAVNVRQPRDCFKSFLKKSSMENRWQFQTPEQAPDTVVRSRLEITSTIKTGTAHSHLFTTSVRCVPGAGGASRSEGAGDVASVPRRDVRPRRQRLRHARHVLRVSMHVWPRCLHYRCGGFRNKVTRLGSI